MVTLVAAAATKGRREETPSGVFVDTPPAGCYKAYWNTGPGGGWGVGSQVFPVFLLSNNPFCSVIQLLPPMSVPIGIGRTIPHTGA